MEVPGRTSGHKFQFEAPRDNFAMRDSTDPLCIHIFDDRHHSENARVIGFATVMPPLGRYSYDPLILEPTVG